MVSSGCVGRGRGRARRSTRGGRVRSAESGVAGPARRGPTPALSDAQLLAAICSDLARSPFQGEGHRKVHARLRILDGIRQGGRERFGAIGEGVARGLRLRHDHGSNSLADDFQQEVAFVGIESSPSFVREPEGNGVADRFIRTLTENLLWVYRTRFLGHTVALRGMA